MNHTQIIKRLRGEHGEPYFGAPVNSVWVDGESVRAAALGIKVEKTAAVPASGSTDDLFTVEGGAVKILSLVGIVETALPANTDLSLQFDPDDGGSDVDLADSATPLAADSDVTGTIYTLGDAVGDDLVASTDVAAAGLGGKALILADSGDIKLTSAGGGAGGGSIHWYLIYVPIETGAYVEAAA